MKSKLICIVFLLFVYSIAIQGQTLRKLNFKANDIVYSLKQNSLYASAPSDNKQYGNTICRLDPNTGQVTKSVFIGTEPTCLAVSEDGQYLYAGLDQLPRIVRLKLPDLQPDLTIHLMDTNSIYRTANHAKQIKVFPNKPTSIAIIVGRLNVIPDFLGIHIYDNAIRRPNTGYDRISLSEVSAMTFLGNNADTLVGFYPGQSFYLIPINNEGIGLSTKAFSDKTTYFDSYIKYSTKDSMLYSGLRILNPRSVTPPFDIVHTFSYTDFFPSGRGSSVFVEPDPYANALFFTHWTENKLLLRRYNSITRLLTQEVTLIDKTEERPRQIINLGKAEKVAVLSENNLFLFDNQCVSSITEVPKIVQGNTASFCSDSSVTLSLNTNNRVLWSTGDTTLSITVKKEGNYSASFIDAKGCAGEPSLPTTVTKLNGVFSPSIFFTDLTIDKSNDISLCQGQTLTLRTSVGFTNAQVKWSTGATTPQITISQAGSYFYEVTNNLGCKGRSSVLTVSSRPQQAPPKPIISSNGKTDLCAWNDSVTLKAPSGYATYTWTNFNTTESITFYSFSPDSVAVKVTNTEGCTSEFSDYVKIRSFQTPIQPILLYKDSILQTTNTSFYQHRWFLNGELIPVAGTSFKPTTAGFYSVQAYSGQCNSPFSDWVNILLPIKTSINDINKAGFIQVYPNPIEHDVFIQIISEIKGGTVELFDNVGRYIKAVKINEMGNQMEMPMSGLVSGHYVLIWKSMDGIVRGVKTIVKL